MSAAEGTSPPGSAPAQATPEAWGGAARLRTPVLSLRNAMEQQAQLQATTPLSYMQQLQQQQESRGDISGSSRRLPQAQDAQGWMQEALKTRRDALTGQLRCQLCAKVVPDHSILAQHLKDKHGGDSAEVSAGGPPEPSLTFSLADLLLAQRPGASKAPAWAPPQLTAKQLRSVKGLVQAYPTKKALAEAFKGGRLLATGKKKMSRLKRIILRERANKAFADASAAAESAAAASRLACALRDNIREQLRVAGEQLLLEQRGGAMPDASAITQLQVLEVAAVEAERRLLDAERNSREAEAELEKASAERARICNEPAGANDEQPPRGVEDADVAGADEAAESGGGASTAHTEGEEAADGSERMQLHALRVATDLGFQGTDGAESVDGLDDFEDVLVTAGPSAEEKEAEKVEEEDEEDLDLGPDDWDDILSAWMGAVGLTDMLKASEPAEMATATASDLSTQTTVAAPPAQQLQEAAPQPPQDSGFSAPYRGDSRSLQSLQQQPAAVSAGFAQLQTPGQQQPRDQNAALAALLGRGNSAGGQRNGAGRPMVTVVPQMDAATSNTLPLLGHGPAPSQGMRMASSVASTAQQGDGSGSVRDPRALRNIPAWLNSADSDDESGVSEAIAGTSPPSVAAAPQSLNRPSASDSPLTVASLPASQASVGAHGATGEPAATAAAAASKQVGPQDPLRRAPPPPGSTPMVVSDMEAQWRARLQGQSFSVEEMIEQGLLFAGDNLGADSPASSCPASPSPSRSAAADTGATAAAQTLESSQAPACAGPSSFEMASSMPQQTDQDRLLHGLQGDASVDAARRRALESILQKHKAPMQASGAGAFPLMDQLPLQPHLMPGAYQDPQLGRMHSQGLLQAYQQAQQRQQMQQQALQSPFRSLSAMDMPLAPQPLLGSLSQGPLSLGDPYGVPGLSSPHDLPLMENPYAAMDFLSQQQLPNKRHGWPTPPEEQGTFGSHEFTCEVCGVTCCGLVNFEQHCSSKKHLRRAAAAAGALAGGGMASDSTGDERNTTYVGLQAQCRNYCKQARGLSVISTELNRAVVELLQQLLFWQERAKASSPYNVTKRKRLVSGLREVAKAVRLRKACTVVVAPNIEQIESEGGLDDLLSSILTQAEEASIPIVFALSRKKLGQMFGCRKKMSAIAILDYSGAEAIYHHMEALAQQGRTAWLAHNAGGGSASAAQADTAAAGPFALSHSGSASHLLGSDPAAQQKGPTPEEGGLYGRSASRTEEAGAAAEFQQRGRYLPGGGAQPHLAMRGSQQPPLLRQQPPPPGALQHRQGGLPPLHRLPPPQQAMSVAHRQAQQQHFQQMGRLASMQSAQELLDGHMASLYDQQALAQQLGSQLHFDGGGAAGGYDALDPSGGLGMSALDLGQHAGSGGLGGPLAPMGGFQGQHAHGMEGAAYGEALYGQGYGGDGDGQQLPYGVEDPRAAQGGHYVAPWPNLGGPQDSGDRRWYS
ncbi:hypothetical protein COCSUDRAFT_46959 [Coccomyxa subellipsoidea C-169]|uniref:C2H2-type domain-containing protein n=1 Tax=Coccomyxa subellipsoidea (strain C-169) TaxID=574566 RepID=I0Z2F4_COCSC|nr:hypothetical protein COCSUDRAFT_46959 [Coccomyxa subellipsoidea C-169]EIE24823.1 hypothetical protein COCSUDRAFT_46959 [Coccomyxa subellipsoidea C-169]|eukprot:XP_005649367.1 hypothetical protein COCSUDRAFT_46959 [Coccomyxa subellipsoidea C-169]